MLSTVAFAEKSHVIWTTFSSGELSPLIDGQVNFDKYFTGVKKLENFIPRPQGPVSNRPGFKYIAGTKTNTAKSRLVPFIFSDEQAYVFEFGNQYIRFFRDGGQITSIDAETVLLLSMNGLDASTTFTDESATPHTMTAVSPAQIDTDQKKFGSGSGIFDGATSAITTPDHADFDLSATDGGIDVWVKPEVGNSGKYTIFRQDVNADSEIYMQVYLDKYTGLLLNGNGIDKSTTITESSLNTKTVVSTDQPFIDTSDPKFGTGAISFTGNDRLAVSSNSDFDIGATGSSEVFIVETFVKTSVNLNEQTLFELFLNSNNFVFFYIDGDTIKARHRADGGTILILSGGSITLNTWTHVVLVGDGTNLSLYVDGIRVDTGTFNDNLNDMSLASLFIGSSDNLTWFLTGSLDDLSYGLVARYSGATLTVPTSENKDIAYPVFEIGDTVPTVDTVKYHDDTITAESFHHIEANYDVSEPQLYLFVDGQLHSGGVQSMTLTASGSLDSVFSIGTDPDGSTLPYKGWMDELRFTNGTLRHTANFTPPIVEYTLLGVTPLEVTTNVDYVQADLFQLQFAQSADILYISHSDYPPKKLIRVTDTNWLLEDINFYPEPVQTQTDSLSANLTLTNKTVGDSALPRTFTASAAVFQSGDVGRIIREKVGYGGGSALIRVFVDTTNVRADIYAEFSSTSINSGEWEIIGNSSTATITLQAASISIGEVLTLTANENVFLATDVGSYVSITNAISGATDTILTKIISYTSATVVTMSAVDAVTFSDTSIAAGDWTIQDPVWTSSDYPTAVTFFENRLLWAGSPSFPQTIWGSVVDDYENHNLGDANDADAYNFTLAGRQVNNIKWLDSSDVLLVGTLGAEWVLGTKGSSTPTTPSNVLARLQTGFGSEPVQSVNIGQSVLFLQKGGEKVREMIFDFNTDKHNSPDMSILAEHITDGGIVEMDYQDDPVSTGWFIRNDGTLLSMTLLREQNVIGWARHITDGSFESIAIIPGLNGDELWAIVNRTIEGATKRYVERMNPLYDDTTLDSDTTFFVDSGLLYTGVETSTITGLDHLDGETVSILADGLVQTDKTVSSGSITLDTAASRVVAGLPYTSTLQTMRVEIKDGKGTAQGRNKRFNRVVFRVDKTKQFQYGQTPDGTLKTHTFDSLYSGDQEVDFVMGNTREGYVSVVNSEPLPISVLAIIPEMNLSD